MARRKNPADDLKFEIVQGPEMTEEEFDSLARLVARIIYDQIMKEQEAQKENQENSSTQDIVKYKVCRSKGNFCGKQEKVGNRYRI